MSVNIAWIIVGVVWILYGALRLYDYLEGKWNKAHPMCDLCWKRTKGSEMNCFTLDYIDFGSEGDKERITLEEAIERDMFVGYEDRNWDVYTQGICNKCLVKYNPITVRE